MNSLFFFPPRPSSVQSSERLWLESNALSAAAPFFPVVGDNLLATPALHRFYVHRCLFPISLFARRFLKAKTDVVLRQPQSLRKYPVYQHKKARATGVLGRLSVSLSLCLSVSLARCLSLALTLCVRVRACVCVCVSLSLSLPVCVCVCVCVSLSLSV